MSGVEAVLAAHVMEYERRCSPEYACSCEEWDGAFDDDGGPDDGRNDNPAAYRAHVAAAIVAHLTSDAVVEAAARAVVDLRFPGDPLVDNDLAVMLTALTAATEATP